MRLYYTPTSPLVRKVRAAALELGLPERIETVLLQPIPTQAHPELSKANPLSEIPALVLEDCSCLYGSRVVCEYLDGLHTGRKLIPPSGAPRFQALRVQALCDGILDAAILV